MHAHLAEAASEIIDFHFLSANKLLHIPDTSTVALPSPLGYPVQSGLSILNAKVARSAGFGCDP